MKTGSKKMVMMLLVFLQNINLKDEGMLLFTVRYLIGSYGVRSDKEALIYIAEQFELKPKIVKLVDEKFYHLDTCFQNLPTNNNDANFLSGSI